MKSCKRLKNENKLRANIREWVITGAGWGRGVGGTYNLNITVYTTERRKYFLHILGTFASFTEYFRQIMPLACSFSLINKRLISHNHILC